MGSRKLTRKPAEYQADILEAITVGKSLREITRDKDMVSIPTIYSWLAADPAFAEHYARAREAQADTLADELVSLADELAKPGTSHEEVQAMRTRLDARKWVAAKLRPGRWGDRVVHSGDADNPLQVDVSLSPKQELLEYLASRSKAIGGEGDDVIDGEVVYPTSHTTQNSETKTQAVDNVGEFSSRRSSSATGSLGDKSKDGG